MSQNTENNTPEKKNLWNFIDNVKGDKVVWIIVLLLIMISALAISEMCVSDLSRLLELNQTTVSHQLRLLKNLNAVKTRRQGKVVFYSLRNETLNDVLLKGVEFLGY